MVVFSPFRVLIHKHFMTRLSNHPCDLDNPLSQTSVSSDDGKSVLLIKGKATVGHNVNLAHSAVSQLPYYHI